MSANFLTLAAEAIPCENAAQKLLKAYYLARAAKSAASDNSLSLPTTSRPKCDKCLTPWDGTDYHMQTKRPPQKPSKRAKHIVHAFESGKRLSKAKTMLAKKLKNKVHIKVATTCKLCSSTVKTTVSTATRRKLRRRKDGIAEQQASTAPLLDITKVELVRPKKRKKDQFAGLNIKPKDVDAYAKLSKPNYVIQPIQKQSVQPSKQLQPKTRPSLQTVRRHKHNVAKDTTATKQRNSMLLLANVLKINESKKMQNLNAGLERLLR